MSLSAASAFSMLSATSEIADRPRARERSRPPPRAPAHGAGAATSPRPREGTSASRRLTAPPRPRRSIRRGCVARRPAPRRCATAREMPAASERERLAHLARSARAASRSPLSRRGPRSVRRHRRRARRDGETSCRRTPIRRPLPPGRSIRPVFSSAAIKRPPATTSAVTPAPLLSRMTTGAAAPSAQRAIRSPFRSAIQTTPAASTAIAGRRSERSEARRRRQGRTASQRISCSFVAA